MVFGSFNLNSETPDLKWTLQGRNVTYTAGDNLKPNVNNVPWAHTFNNNGTKFYIVLTGTNNSNTYTLSRPYDLTSVTSAVTFTALNTGGVNWTAVSFSPDYKYYAATTDSTTIRIVTCATRGVISGSDTILTSLTSSTIGTLNGVAWCGQNYIFTLSTTQLISKLLFDETAGTITYTGQQVDVSAVASARGLIMNRVGTTILVGDTSATKTIYEYRLRTPYDLTTYVLAPISFNMATIITDEPATINLTEISTNPEMTRIYVSDFSTSIANSRVYQLRIK
jgi:hypothetical protein